MLVHFAAGLVQRLERRARELELSAGLQRDRAVTLGERDRILALQHRRPAEAREPLEESADAVRPLIRHALQVGAPEHEFLVLRADAPALRRLAAGLEVLDQLAPVGDRRARGLSGTGHELERLSASSMSILPPRRRPPTRAASLRRLAANPPEAPGTRPGRERRRIGAQHARTQTDGANKGKFPERVKLPFCESALGSREQAPNAGLLCTERRGDVGRRAGLVAEQEPAI